MIMGEEYRRNQNVSTSSIVIRTKTDLRLVQIILSKPHQSRSSGPLGINPIRLERVTAKMDGSKLEEALASRTGA